MRAEHQARSWQGNLGVACVLDHHIIYSVYMCLDSSAAHKLVFHRSISGVDSVIL